MNNPDDPAEITCEFLQTSIERAVYSTSATLPGDAFREILKLATRQKTFAVLGLDHLMQKRHLYEVKLSGDEWRSSQRRGASSEDVTGGRAEPVAVNIFKLKSQ